MIKEVEHFYAAKLDRQTDEILELIKGPSVDRSEIDDHVERENHFNGDDSDYYYGIVVEQRNVTVALM